MSSLPVQTDNSVQLSYSSFPFTITNVDNYASSNYVSNISNILKANIDTKQNLLTAATNLLGIGTAITAIDYNKISVNKPTNFQADWLTTIINKPTYFQTDWNSTISNKPTNFQADWLSTIINKPSTFPADMSIIYTKNEVNNISNVLQTNINTKENILTFSSPLTRTTNTIGINLASYSTTGNDANYLLKTGGDISGTLNFGSRTQNFLINLYATNEYGFGIIGGGLMYQSMGSHQFYTNQILKASISSSGTITATTFSGSGSSLTDIPYANITGKPTNFQADWLTTIINKPSTFPADMTNIYTKIETNNLLNAKEAVLTFSSPLTRTTNTIGINLGSYSTTGNDANYLLKTGGTMSGQISGITILNATTINSSTIFSTTNNASTLGPTKGINGGNGDRLVLWSGAVNDYPYSLGIDSYTLWYSVPNGASHKFYHYGSLITTISSTGLSTTGTISGTTFSGSGSSLTNIQYANITGKPTNFQADWLTTIINKPSTFTPDTTNIYTKTETDGRYLQLSGGSITGDLTLNKTNPGIQLGGTNGNNWAVAGANGYYSESAVAGDMVLRSLQKLHLQAGGAKSAMTISTNNNIGIGTDTEYSTATKLIIKGTSSGASQPIVRIEQLAPWNGGTNNYAFQVSGYSDLGGIRINGTDTYNTIFTTGDNDMGISTKAGVIKFLTNSGTERMRILNNGNVGIGTDNSSSKLTVEGRTITGNGSSTYSSVFSGNTVGLTVANTAGTGNPEQLVICDTANANTALLLGSKYNAGDAFSVIQSIVAGAGYKTLSLNPNGGNIGIGTTNPSALLTLTSPTQSIARILLSGQEFYTGGFSQTSGIALLLGVNRDNNKQLWITNSANLAQNATNAVVRIGAEASGYIDCIATNGTTALPMAIGGSSITLNNNTTINGNLTIANAATVLSFGSRINDFLINLYATNEYGFGINANTLRYNTLANHSFYCNGIMKANINSSGTIEATTLSGTTVFASGTSKASKFMVRLGEQTGYNYNWNGTGLSGWFIGLNQFWSANSDNAGTAYLTMTVCGSTNYQYCWFGRVFVKGDGYTWSIITDYKTPTSGVYELFVTEHFDGGGNNVLRFRTSTPGVLTENLRFKICG